MSYPTQSNTRQGDFPVIALDDLSSKEGYLVHIVNDSGVAKAALPDANLDAALFVVILGAAVGSRATLRPISAERSFRVTLEGTCNPGDKLVLADVATPADAGMVRALPATAGDYRVLAVADEAGVDGQLVRARAVGFARQHVPTTVDLDSTDGTAAAASADLAALAAEAELIGDDVRAMHAALVAQGILVTT